MNFTWEARLTLLVFSVSDVCPTLAGIFPFQEFKEGRKGNSQAPQVLYSKDVPQELTDTQALQGDNVGYITFGLFFVFHDRSSLSLSHCLHTSRRHAVC